MLSDCSIFLQFFLACTQISIICLHSFVIIAQSHPGEGYPQYCVILSTASILSTMRCVSNCWQTISLYCFTNECWDVMSCLLTGRHILCLKSPQRERVEILKQRLLWSPGLSANVCRLRLTISISGDEYAPSIRELPG